jgi:UDP-2,4-diacetamido-2,4,6-trideoxy-beta-L-altropyranose hydrolase
MPITPDVGVVFRVAAGPRLGFGHLARCRAIGRALGVTPRVSIRGTAATARVAAALGLTVAPGGRRVVLTRGLDLLVLDDPSCAAGRPWVAAARRAGLPVVAVHDGARRPHLADLVIDGSPTVPVVRTRRRLAGLHVAVVDPTVAVLRRHKGMRRDSIVLALGGGRHVVRATPSLVAALRSEMPDARIVVAPGFTAGPRPRIEGATWLAADGLAEALARARVAVVGGGLTALEAAALGAPSVAVAVVPAQRPNVRALARHGVVCDGGLLSADAPRRLARRTARLWHATSEREALSRAGRRLVDGCGAERIATAVRRLAARGRTR